MKKGYRKAGMMVDEVEERASEMLRDLTESITKTPQALVDLYTYLRVQYKNDPGALEKLDAIARDFVARIPEMTRVVSDYTKVLETYLSHRISLRQENATETLVKQNAILVRHNKLLSYATISLAIATFALVLVTVFRA